VAARGAAPKLARPPEEQTLQSKGGLFFGLYRDPLEPVDGPVRKR
jgi:hypothetical protein